jgi:CHASE2 domain-containing sensor protein/signal transduction histidine kinase
MTQIDNALPETARQAGFFRHPVFREWWLIVIGLSVLSVLAIRGEWLSRLELTLYDQAMRVWSRPATPDVVIIGIDEDSLQQIGRWPWSRAVHATLLDKISEAKPKIIALDLILSEADRRDPNADQSLADAIQRAGNVIVSVAPKLSEGAMQGEARPIAAITAAAMTMAHISAQADGDGVMRRALLRARFANTPEGVVYRSLCAEAWARAHENAHANTHANANTGRDTKFALDNSVNHSRDVMPNPLKRLDSRASSDNRPDAYIIPYLGKPGSVKTISFIDVLRGDVKPEALRDKVVLIGMTAAGTGDEYPVPVAGADRSMAGVEIHANVFQALDDGIRLREATRGQVAVGTILIIFILMLGFLWLTPRRALLLAVGTIASLVLGAVLLFRFGQIWFSPTIAIGAVLLAYPLWSWRKLEATQRYFDAEMQRLNDEPWIVPDTAARVIAPGGLGALSRFVPDVIERRIASITAASARMRSLKRFVEVAIESLPTAALVTDHDGRIMLSNTTADRLLTPQGAGTTGKVIALEDRMILDVLNALTPEEVGGWPHVWKRASMEAATTTVEALRVLGATEENFVVQFAPLVTTASRVGSVSGVIVSIVDVTPLHESERRRDEALRFLSHDMRSPQAAILTMLEMVREEPESIPHDTLLARIGKYSRRTLNLADDFLRLAKAERARPADFREVELGEILSDVADEAESLASAKLIRIEIDNHADEAWVLADRDLLTRAIINLVSNAIKYSPEKTMIVIALDAVSGEDNKNENDANVVEGDMWRIRVADQGFGIAPENLAKLFTRFQRFSTDDQPQTDGIGLGLVFVKTVVERLGGEISVTSRTEADAHGTRGTTFAVSLPVSQEQGE